MQNAVMYEALGLAIRARRETLEMTQDELAKRVGLSRASVTNIELGRQSVLVDQLFRFAEALMISPILLLSAAEIKPAPKPLEPLSPEVAEWIERVRKSHT